MSIRVFTGERVDVPYGNRTVSTVVISVNGRLFTHDAKDAVDALNVCVQTARTLGVRLGLED